MKLSRLFLPLGLLLATLSTACGSDSPSEHHEISLYPLAPHGRLLYADQDEDSIYVKSTESWSAQASVPEGSTAWFTISPQQQQVPKQHLLLQKVAITAQPNTTGQVRHGRVLVQPLQQGLGRLGMPLTQLPWLDIRRPAPAIAPGATLPTFAEELPYNQAHYTIAFHLHTHDLSSVSLQSDAPWCLLPQAGSYTLQRGDNEVKLQLLPNPTRQRRSALITLTSGGARSSIHLLQREQP